MGCSYSNVSKKHIANKQPKLEATICQLYDSALDMVRIVFRDFIDEATLFLQAADLMIFGFESRARSTSLVADTSVARDARREELQNSELLTQVPGCIYR